jgi:hypothetical protein
LKKRGVFASALVRKGIFCPNSSGAMILRKILMEKKWV